MDEYFRLRAREVECNGIFYRGKESAVENPISFVFLSEKHVVPLIRTVWGKQF